MSIGTTETPQCNSRGTVANIAMCEPCNVITTLTRVAGGQSIVGKAQNHNVFVQVLFLLHLACCVGPNVDKLSTSLSHQVRVNVTIFNRD